MEKRVVRLKNVMLGEGVPKVCVPVMGKDLRELARAAEAARGQADIIELRLDSVSPGCCGARAKQSAGRRGTCPCWRRCAPFATAARAAGMKAAMKRC